MIKFLFKSVLVIALLVVAVGAIGIYSARSLPNWFDETKANTDFAGETIRKELGSKNQNQFLADKSKEILSGNVSFDEGEFNALMLAAIKADADGRKLLAVSDGVKAFLRRDEIEIAAVINLNKLGKIDPKARKKIEKFDKLFWIIDDGRVAVSLYGTPVARRGGLGIKDDFHLKVGQIPFSNNTLRSLKVPVEKANKERMSVKYLNVKSVSVSKGKIDFQVQPRL